jgi:hypothetical protein
MTPVFFLHKKMEKILETKKASNHSSDPFIVSIVVLFATEVSE